MKLIFPMQTKDLQAVGRYYRATVELLKSFGGAASPRSVSLVTFVSLGYTQMAKFAPQSQLVT